jgi:hypothetical protein
MICVKTKVSEWLEKHRTKWQADIGEGRTKQDFANHLGVSINTYKNWDLRGHTPEPHHVELLDRKLDDQTIYDIVGLPRPDPVLRAINRDWGKFENGIKSKVRELLYGSNGREATERPKPRVGKSKRG